MHEYGTGVTFRLLNLVRALCVAALLAFAASALSSPANARESAEPAVPGEDEAPIVHLVDVTSGQVLYSRNADRRFIPASMTKVMTVFLAFELIEEGKLSPAQVMTIREDTWREWAQKGSTMFLPADARVRVGDLIGGSPTFRRMMVR